MTMIYSRPEHLLGSSEFENAKGKCWYQLSQRNGYRLCQNRVNKDDVHRGATLLQEIEDGHFIGVALDHALMELLNLNCCIRDHRKGGDENLKRQICSRWKDQLSTTECNARNHAVEQPSSTVAVTATSNSNRPSTRSQTKKEKDVSTTQAPAHNSEQGPCFVHRQRAHHELSHLIFDRLTRDLTKNCLKDGCVYTYTDEASGFKKVGWTQYGVSERRERTESACKISTQPGYQTAIVPHPYHIEQLSLLELEMIGLRRMLFCKCRKVHREWFNDSDQEVEEVVRTWTEWMVRGEPYEGKKLKPLWREIIEGMESADQEITGRALVDRIPQSHVPKAVEEIQEHGLEEDFGDAPTLLESLADDTVPTPAKIPTSDDSSSPEMPAPPSRVKGTSSTATRPAFDPRPEPTSTSRTSGTGTAQLLSEMKALQDQMVSQVEILAQHWLQLSPSELEMIARIQHSLAASYMQMDRFLRWNSQPRSFALSPRMRPQPRSYSPSTFRSPPPLRSSVPVSVSRFGTVAA
ncbi:T5orf172 domain-containing protein [Cladophialophora immunda]|nr:T5orf172 domain-containing protein [Cladophialophora immunda]